MAEKKTTTKKPTEKKLQYVTVKCALLNVRLKPDKESGIAKQVSEGEKLEKLGTVKDGAWVKVPGGYVMAEFVS